MRLDLNDLEGELLLLRSGVLPSQVAPLTAEGGGGGGGGGVWRVLGVFSARGAAAGMADAGAGVAKMASAREGGGGGGGGGGGAGSASPPPAARGVPIARPGACFDTLRSPSCCRSSSAVTDTGALVALAQPEQPV